MAARAAVAREAVPQEEETAARMVAAKVVEAQEDATSWEAEAAQKVAVTTQ